MLNKRMGVSVDEVCIGVIHLFLEQPERTIGRRDPLLLGSLSRKPHAISVRPEHHRQ
jgi:hypothetical protein